MQWFHHLERGIKTVTLPNLIDLVSSIFAGTASFNLAEDWVFLEEVQSAGYFNQEDLTINEEINLL